jgi:hypothetical protein
MLFSLMAAEAAQRSTHDVVYAAIIAASAAIVGGIIGGSIPGHFMLKAEDKRHANALAIANQARDDERERERRAIIGAARALHEFFERLGVIVGVSLETRRWWTNELDATLQPPPFDDQKAVLGQLTSHEALVVSTTMRAIELLRTLRGMQMEDDPSRLLDEAATATVESGRTAAQDGARFLRRVADLPPPTTES